MPCFAFNAKKMFGVINKCRMQNDNRCSKHNKYKDSFSQCKFQIINKLKECCIWLLRRQQ